jgi:hypothetical protein
MKTKATRKRSQPDEQKGRAIVIICEESGPGALGQQSGDIIFSNGAFPGNEIFRFRKIDGALVIAQGAAVISALGNISPSFTLGATIASAATIAPTNGSHNVSGTTQITTITPPAWVVAGSEIALIPTGLWTTATGGNISLGSTAVVHKPIWFLWDGAAWNPSY